jgi:hypothetical protein
MLRIKPGDRERWWQVVPAGARWCPLLPAFAYIEL